ncbi:lysophospholipid acyltransferase family protein [Persicirhabdus sediminis]|uniref:1-acyl-sn-glycerol-3-phosphate acyltransferase n=1 Tax=Persicirhabdus sediminis TaxID=454144 RepID=A0A8J7MER8_9BACT|nr:lysophospholipid acyltransferase family protein [Persicirhabdus sediminis]MBK1791345.1 1-acyl-sn-glycerol-3-phosphate acyltransferase [Persicirhabdus sediminis]
MKLVYWLGQRFFRAFSRSFFSYRVVNKEKMVEDGSVLIACNHESFLDPPFIAAAYDKENYYVARHTLFRGLGAWLYPRWNAFPVRQGEADLSSVKKMISLLKQGNRVVIFPEGARTLDGKIQEAQAGTGMVAVRSKALIQPIRIVGAFDALPRGSGRMRRHPIKLIVGDPFYLTEDELKTKGSDGYKKIAQKILDKVSELEE